VVVDLPGAGQAAVTVAARSIERANPAFYPMLLGNSVLGGSSTARLFQEVRVKRALSYGASSGLGVRREEGAFTATAQTKNESAAEVAQVMLAEIERLGREPIDEETLTKRKTFQAGAFGRQVESSLGLGGFLAGLATQGLPMSEFERYLPGLQAVTPQQVGAAVTAELPANQASIVIVGDAKAFLEPLRARYPQAEVIPFADLDLGSPTLRRASAPASP
jgi:zinc protease